MTEGKSGCRISTKLVDRANYVKKVVYTPIWTRHGVLFNYNPAQDGGTRCSDGTLDKDFKAASPSLILSFQHNLGQEFRTRDRDESRSKLPIRSSPATGLPLLGVIGGNFGGNSP